MKGTTMTTTKTAAETQAARAALEAEETEAARQTFGAAARPPDGRPRAAMTPAQAAAFVAAHLPGLDPIDEGDWIAARLADGTLAACPVCRCVSLPGPCPVCAQVAHVAKDFFCMDREEKSFTGAAAGLAHLAQERARMFHELYMNTFNAADALLAVRMVQPLLAARGEAGVAEAAEAPQPYSRFRDE